MKNLLKSSNIILLVLFVFLICTCKKGKPIGLICQLNLSQMKKLILVSVILTLVSIVFSCKKKNSLETPEILPIVTTDAITDINITSAYCWSTITSDGGSEIIARGVCWATTMDPKISDNRTVEYGYPPESTRSEVVSLIPNTLYFIRGYATNLSGTGYGEVKFFETIQPKSIASTLVCSSSPTSATVGGIITSDFSEAAITERGVYWGTSQDTTSLNNKIIIGSGSGIYSTVISGLIPNSVYYVRAYVVGPGGISYGDVVSFTSYGDNSIRDIDGNYYNTVVIGSQVWMKENLKVTKFSDGSPINKVTDPKLWFTSLSSPVYVEVDDSYTNPYHTNYGNYYNSFTVSDSRSICPAGWHVPSDAEWLTLETYLGGDAVAGGKLKSVGGWTNPNTGATNESGFTAYPDACNIFPASPGIGAYTYPPFQVINRRTTGYWWSISENYRRVEYYSPVFFTNGESKNPVYSIRCLKN